MNRPDLEICFEGGGVEPYAHIKEIQKENLDVEVAPEEINLKSFKVRDYLENHIWNEDNSLDLRVRNALMDISDDFWETCNIRWVKPKTVLLTGSICNFNWSEYSDIDVHVVVDFSEIHENKDFVQEYFNEKKNDWNNSHEGLKVYGYPVEMYVEDINAETESGGIYDLWKNKWVKKPVGGNIEPIKLNKYAIKDIASEIMTEIDDLSDASEDEYDGHKIEEIYDEVKELRDKIKAMRKIGLKHGESGSLNIVFKVLRRSGYLDKLMDLSHSLYDKMNSIDDNINFKKKITNKF